MSHVFHTTTSPIDDLNRQDRRAVFRLKVGLAWFAVLSVLALIWGCNDPQPVTNQSTPPTLNVTERPATVSIPTFDSLTQLQPMDRMGQPIGSPLLLRLVFADFDIVNREVRRYGRKGGDVYGFAVESPGSAAIWVCWSDQRDRFGRPLPMMNTLGHELLHLRGLNGDWLE